MPESEQPTTSIDRSLRPRSPVPAPQHTQTKRGDVLTAISDGLVALQKEFYGKGPTQAKSYYEDDLVVCILRGGFTRVEETLLHGGRGEAVLRQRREFQAILRDGYEAVVEHATGRPVIAFSPATSRIRT